ncbi:MAG: hypothetical protein ACXABD_14575 [Candidatus Thorarchaeota archaeon]|jgi:hypothetical protein
MATTYRQALNRVLEIIGEDNIPGAATTLTSEYHLLIGALFNEIMEQVEDAHNWRALRTTYTVTVPAQALSGTITDASERSRLVRIYQANRHSVVPLVFDVTDASNPDPLIEIDLSEIIYRDTVNPNEYQDPVYFALDNSAGDGMDLYVNPRPSGSKSIQVTMVTPQGRADFTQQNVLSANISVPVRPIVMGTVWYALEERGEELGTQGLFSEQRFMQALDDAIARDAAEQGDNMELISV